MGLKAVEVLETAPQNAVPRLKITTNKFFKQFFKDHPQFAHIRQEFTNAELKSFIKRFNTNLGQAAIDNRDGILLPSRLGHIFMSTYVPVGRCVVLKYLRQGEVIYTNNHSDGRVLCIQYRSGARRFNFENKGLWDFYPSRPFKKRASMVFGKKWELYHQLEDWRAIRKRMAEYFKSLKNEPDDN